VNEVVPYGRSAYLVSPAPSATPLDLALAISGAPRDDVCEVVPAAATVLVTTSREPASDLPAWLAGVVPAPGARREAAVIEIDVVYDGEDLEAVARACGLPIDGVVARHTAVAYRCEFSGFAPGFGYLSGLDPVLHLPRRPTPRPRVPAGSVAVADRYSAVYPPASPGGWHLLGRTATRLWDHRLDPPALISPGTTVRFRAVERLSEPLAQSAAPADPAARGEPSLVIVSCGISTTVQDAGRPGYAAVGLTAAGAVDRDASAIVNRLVGNPAESAVLETAGGLVVEALRPITVADSASGAVSTLSVGDRVTVSPRPDDAWAYLAVRGGLAVEPVLGSRSTHTLGDVGPARPTDGTVYQIGPDPGTPIVTDHAPPRPSVDGRIRLDEGPHRDWFTAASLDRLVSATWRIGADRSRIGVRLDGSALERATSAATRELASEGVVAGAVQVPPDGRPVVMLADHPVTGGYPVIAVVHPDDLVAFAQRPTGRPVRFAVSRPR
jgi:KipI family sensor histidine kinase inhibitor